MTNQVIPSDWNTLFSYPVLWTMVNAIGMIGSSHKLGYILERNPTFELSSSRGNDNSKFDIQGNALRLTKAQDFEASSAPLNVRIKVTDRHGLSYEQDIAVSISDVNECQHFLPTTPQKTAQPVAWALYFYRLPDQSDTFTFTLVDGRGQGQRLFYN